MPSPVRYAVLGLVLLAGALVVGAARPSLQETTGVAGKPIGQNAYWWWLEPVRTTLWCGHDLYTTADWPYRGAEWAFSREDGGMAPLRKLGDFDGDGNDDVLLRHADGRWHYYQMNGRRVLSSGAADLTQDLTWQVAGIGDFNGDGKDDVLLWHADGAIQRLHYYAMDGRRVLADSGPVVLPNFNGDFFDVVRDFSFNWQMAIGDFDGDDRDDVLLRYTIPDSATQPFYDRWHFYRMDGRRVLSGSGRARLTRDEAWRIAGIADLNRDGKDDVLLRKADGRWYFYPMDGRTVLPGRGTVRMTRDLAWQVMGIGHFDGDVRKSVLLRHPNGRWRYYRIQGRQVAGRPSRRGPPGRHLRDGRRRRRPERRRPHGRAGATRRRRLAVPRAVRRPRCIVWHWTVRRTGVEQRPRVGRALLQQLGDGHDAARPNLHRQPRRDDLPLLPSRGRSSRTGPTRPRRHLRRSRIEPGPATPTWCGRA